MKPISRNILIAAVAIAFVPTTASAQNDDVADRANEIAEQAGELANEVAVSQERSEAEQGTTGVAREDADDDGTGDWGLLGLLGLAGLLGLRKRDHVHSTTRTDTGTGTGTGTGF